MTTTTLDALLRAILDNPAGDARRLVYADALDDAGERERGEFVRVQVRIAEINREINSEEDCGSGHCIPCYERRGLRDRERELLEYLSVDWSDTPIDWAFGTRRPDGCMNTVVFRRGFVAEVHCTCADWLAHGRDIMRRHPVEIVRLVDKRPWHDRHNARWIWLADTGTKPSFSEEDCIVSRELLGALAGMYRIEQAALDALSAAALAWGKEG